MAAMSAMEPHHVNGSLGEWASRDHTPPPRCFASLVRPLAASFGLLRRVCSACVHTLGSPVTWAALGEGSSN